MHKKLNKSLLNIFVKKSNFLYKNVVIYIIRTNKKEKFLNKIIKKERFLNYEKIQL